MGEWKRLWREERGAVVTTELILIGTIVGLGMIPAYAILRHALAIEFCDSAACMSAYDQGRGWWGDDNDHDWDHNWDFNGSDNHADHRDGADGRSRHRFVHVKTVDSTLGH